MAQGVESMWSIMKLHHISEHLCTNVQDLTETHQSARGLHLLLCWCAAFDSMILLSISCRSCKAAVNAMTQGYVPFVDSAELACGTLTAQCRANFFRSNRVKSTCPSTESTVYEFMTMFTIEAYWSTLKHANQIRSRANLSESSWWAATLSMRCGHMQFRRKLWRTQSFWGQKWGVQNIGCSCK